MSHPLRRVLVAVLSLAAVALAGAGIGVFLAHRSANPTANSSGAAPAPGASAGTGSELAFDAAHLDLVVIKPGPINPDGSMGANRSGYHTVGEQRHIDPHVIHGLVTEDTGELSSSITAMEYAFAHQNPDGSFQVVQFTGTGVTLQTYDPVGVDFFLSDLGHCLVLLDESSWFHSSAQTAALRQRLEALRPRIVTSLQWLSQPAQVAAIEKDGTRDTNRLAIASAAYMLVGRWTDDAAAIQVGTTMTQEVIGRVTPDGVIPENGGFDSSYQTVSLLHLYWIDLHAIAAAPALKAPLEDAISRALGRELQNVQTGGQISTTANTRVYCGGESFRGKAKGGDFRDVVIVLVYQSTRTGQSSQLQTAQSVAGYYAQHPGGPAAC